MKKIECIIRPFKLEEVKEALEGLDIGGLTVSDVFGFGKQRGYPEYYRGTEVRTKLVAKLRIEVVVPDILVPAVLDAVAEAARTGAVGDGKIFVTQVEECLRVRTGERGEAALR